MDDLLIIGGGVVGLSLAWEAAGAGLRVHVVDQGQPGQEASWAGAGILPPGGPQHARTPLEALVGLSNELHPRWSEALREETGIDNGYRRCGGLYLARNPAAAEQLLNEAAQWRERRVPSELLDGPAIARLEPELSPRGAQAARPTGLYLPDEAQLRNPRHLKALLVACLRRGVTISAGTRVEGFERSGERVVAVRTTLARLTPAQLCIASGAWSGNLLSQLAGAAHAREPGAQRPAVFPVRGQIVLLNTGRPLFARVINEGRRYLVPRPDGRVLVGSTEEQVGFDKRNTADGVGGLLEFATSLVPALAAATLERCWAGLRPCTPDGLPYLGRVPGTSNAFMATGHFRAGLQLSPGTAVALCRLIRGESPGLDLQAFQADRVAA